MKILCIQLKQLGDVLMTTPAVRALARHYPGCEIDFMTQKPADSVYRHSPYVRRVYCVRWKLRELLPLLYRIYRRKYDLLVDFSGSSKTANFARLTRIPRRIGVAADGRNGGFTATLPVPSDTTYSALRKLRLLTLVGIEAQDPELDFFVSDDEQRRFSEKMDALGIDDRPLIAVSPVSKRVYKVWPAERFAEICDRLVETYDARIFFLIGPGESRFAEAVRAAMRHETLAIDDSLSLAEAACLLDRALCYVGNDNGLMHLSIARKRPTFAIFGRPLARNWASPLPLQHAFEHDPGCKENCVYPACELECLSGISVDRVWQTLRRQLPAIASG